MLKLNIYTIFIKNEHLRNNKKFEPIHRGGEVKNSLVPLRYFERNINQPSPFKNMLAGSAYTVYIIHPVIIVGLSLLLHHTSLYPTIKFIIVSFVGTIICFAIGYVVTLIPNIKRIL